MRTLTNNEGPTQRTDEAHGRLEPEVGLAPRWYGAASDNCIQGARSKLLQLWAVI
jgi:hypothetical protein